MVQLDTFAIEEWMTRYETTPGVINIAEVCAASVSIDELVGLNSEKDAPGPLNFAAKLTYGTVPGSEALRRNIASLYEKDATNSAMSTENVIITQGTIAANFLVYFSLLSPGDHVVSVYPAFQQLYSLPKSLGAEVSLWEYKKENGYIPDVKELQQLVKKNTKLIVINNPHNPSGSTTPREVLASIVEFAKERGIIILSDDIYRPLYHSLGNQEVPPSILSLGYEKTISTSSMSKTFALAGLRLGWIATRDLSLRQAITSAREYTTITVSQLDDQVASYALSDKVLPGLLARNMNLAKTNLALLDAFMQKYSAHCSWVKPTAGTMAFVRVNKKRGELVDDVSFCLDVLDKTKVFVVPGSVAFGGGKDFKGYVRIGYVCHTAVLKEGLEKLGSYIESHLV